MIQRIDTRPTLLHGLLLSLFLTTISVIGVQASDESSPNIIFINVDDLGWADLSCQGSKYYQTPNIDKLASQGMTFSNAYAAAANCAPSRACALTGQFTPRHGVYTVNNSDRGRARDRKLIPTPNTTSILKSHLTMGEALQQGGYVTASIGKWHVSKNPLNHGFDVNIAGKHAGGPYNGGYLAPYEYPNCISKTDDEQLTDRLTDEAMQFIETNSAKKFFLYLPYYTVHSPLQAKKEKIDKYKKLKGNKAHKHPVYAAMIESLDENIGRLMQKIDKLGLAENTLIVFTSDNGGVWKTSKQWPLRGGKGCYYEGGIREPLFVRWSGKIKAGSRSSTPVTHLDLFPTFLAATNTPRPKGKILDGDNLVPLLTHEAELKDRALYWHFPIYLQAYAKDNTGNRDLKFRTRPGSVIRHGKWKLHEYFEDGGLELYDLDYDLSEKQNLASKHPEKVKELHSMLKKWRTETKAPVPTELNPKYKVTK